MDADVLVVGAGPAGATAAAYLAQAGIDTLVLDKATFPRQKACGDGLTPRAVKELVALGVPTPTDEGWMRNRGLRVFGGGHSLELPWPTVAGYPEYGLTLPRDQFDHRLVRHAQQRGARFEQGVTVVGALVNHQTGRVEGVRVRHGEGERHYRARLVIEASGVAARMATSVGRERNAKRPLGVAVRSRYQLSRPLADPSQTEWMESHLDLWDGPAGQGKLMPGYGWVFPEAGGTVNVGVGSVGSNGAASHINHRLLLTKWVGNLEQRWGISEATQVDPPRGAGLPMAFNRQPLYGRGLLLVGDAAGLVSPFDGEGIGQAMESGRVAAECVAQALACITASGREAALRAYPQRMKQSLGGYFQLGRVFVKLIEHPRIMRACTDYGLPRPTLMRLVNKLLSNLYEVRGGNWMDRLIATAARLAPAA